MVYVLHYVPDNASLVVRLVLEELGQPYATELVDRSSDAHKSAAYRKLNPNGLIPVLETPEGPVFETAAILLWLADRHGALAPAATDPDRAGFLSWLFFLSNTLHAELRLLFYPHEYHRQAPEALRQNVRERLAVHLDLIEDRMPFGTDLTVIDYYLACQCRWMALYPENADRSWFSLDNRTRLRSRLAWLEERPATRAAQLAEGLGPTPFTEPHHPSQPHGAAT